MSSGKQEHECARVKIGFSLPQRFWFFACPTKDSHSSNRFDGTLLVPPAIYSIPPLRNHDSLIQTPLRFQGGRAPNQARRGSTKPHWAKRAALHANGTLGSAHNRVPTSTSTINAPPGCGRWPRQRWNGFSSWPALHICVAIAHPV